MSDLIPVGYCQCGCGRETRISNRTSTEKGWLKGQPRPYRVGHNGRKHSLAYREDADSGCWDWLGSKTWNGYGQGSIDGDQFLAHRLYWERERGPIPEGMRVDHLCRNRGCVNPAHLELVTHAENSRRGTATILTETQAREIKRAPRERGSRKALATKYGVSTATIDAIRCGRLWPDVT